MNRGGSRGRVPNTKIEVDALRSVARTLRLVVRDYRLPTDDGLLLGPGYWLEEEIRRGRAPITKNMHALPNWGVQGESGWMIAYKAWTLLRPPWALKPFALRLVERVEPSLEARKEALRGVGLLDDQPGSLGISSARWSSRYPNRTEEMLAVLDLDRIDEAAAAGFLALEPP